MTKTTDGREVAGLHERFVHAYVPYGPGDEALCNIGTYPGARGGGGDDGGDDGGDRGGNVRGGGSSPIIVRCTVLGYQPRATGGAMLLQGSYEVRVHATRASGEHDATLPVWKLQRRYLAK